ncbi:MAG: pyrroline-5-carboxylate reductase [Candidatus Omnitrophica bacterium]|nr:pyrroline-5-carboxylate reductase [Candidatus Omnitrophota bacterium]
MKKKIIGIIGGGNMGEAFIKGLVEKKLFLSSNVLVCEADEKRARYLKDKYRVQTGDLLKVSTQSSTLILAVKPQDIENVLVGADFMSARLSGGHKVRPYNKIHVSNKLFISIAAGLTTSFFEKHLNGQARVVRAMPNMPALIGEGMTGVCQGRFASLADMKEALRVLSAVGKVVEVSEKYMDAVTAVSGSGPAYVFLFVEAWIKAAQALGFNDKQAQDLVYETLCGSAHLLKETHFSAGELRAKVTSKKGTTEAAMKVLLAGNKFSHMMTRALTAAQKRAGELAR